MKRKKRSSAVRTTKPVRENIALYVMLLPAVIYIALLHYWPMYGVQIAFKNFNFADGITGSPFVGMKWFHYFFHSSLFGTVVWNTISLSIYGLLAGFPIPIILALMLHNLPSQKFRRVAQTVSYLPHFISIVVLVGMMNCMFSINSGWVNGLIKAMGGTPVHLMGETKYFRHIYVWSGVWQQMGWNSIIYLAALTGIDPMLHEAAMIDGASKLRRIWHVDLPGILPTVSIMLIMQFGRMMSIGFDKAYIMQNSMNINASEVISTYVYKQGIMNNKYSFSTAVGLFNNLINFILLVTVNKITGKLSGSSLW